MCVTVSFSFSSLAYLTGISPVITPQGTVLKHLTHKKGNIGFVKIYVTFSICDNFAPCEILEMLLI